MSFKEAKRVVIGCVGFLSPPLSVVRKDNRLVVIATD